MLWLKKIFGLEKNNSNNIMDNSTIIEQNTYLDKIKYNDVDFFNLNGFKTWAKCVKVYDGDTGTFVFFFNNKPFKFRVRLAGIDTPEIKSNNPDEMAVGILARNKLQGLIYDKLVFLECLRWDKYGRLLAKIYSDNIIQKSINQTLIDENLAAG